MTELSIEDGEAEELVDAQFEDPKGDLQKYKAMFVQCQKYEKHLDQLDAFMEHTKEMRKTVKQKLVRAIDQAHHFARADKNLKVDGKVTLLIPSVGQFSELAPTKKIHVPKHLQEAVKDRWGVTKTVFSQEAMNKELKPRIESGSVKIDRGLLYNSKTGEVIDGPVLKESVRLKTPFKHFKSSDLEREEK